ncbi:MAG: nickel pincer cofactor biosynthesis protein LarB [Eubacterium sp.]
MDINRLLEDVKNGVVSTEEAAALLKRSPYDDLYYAKLDTHREIRQGFSEIVFCSGKRHRQLVNIFKSLYDTHGEAMGTRATAEQYEAVREQIPSAQYDRESRIIKIEKSDKKRSGKVVVCTAGTADIPVAKEAIETAEFLGAKVEAIFDIGVSGIHRLLDNLDSLQSANCVIAVAGMEGALASVIGGLVSCPVIAVPTSVGYGASFEGLSALLTMINSCANGVATVNIDNGFGAGYLAAQINRQSIK